MPVELLAIVGQTATGKSTLGLQVAQAFGGEIVAADSRTVYRHLDIGTAKPTAADQAQVKHHLLDLFEPDAACTVYQFQQLAYQAIKQIRQRQRLPILVGGSGLYVDSVLCQYVFPPDASANWSLRQQLETLTIEQLQAAIKAQQLALPANSTNRRYLVRTLEKGATVGTKTPSFMPNTLVVGLKLPKQLLEQRISDRLQAMLAAGLLAELKTAWATYPAGCEALKGNIYATFKPYLDGQISLSMACEQFVHKDLALAKKQLTWFKRHPQIHWFEDIKEAYAFIATTLSSAVL